MKKILSNNVLKMIGMEKVRSYDVTKKDIRRFAQAIDDSNPLYCDEEYAKNTKFKSIIAPPLFVQTFAFEDVPINKLPVLFTGISVFSCICHLVDPSTTNCILS